MLSIHWIQTPQLLRLLTRTSQTLSRTFRIFRIDTSIACFFSSKWKGFWHQDTRTCSGGSCVDGRRSVYWSKGVNLKIHLWHAEACENILLAPRQMKNFHDSRDALHRDWNENFESEVVWVMFSQASKCQTKGKFLFSFSSDAETWIKWAQNEWKQIGGVWSCSIWRICRWWHLVPCGNSSFVREHQHVSAEWVALVKLEVLAEKQRWTMSTTGGPAGEVVVWTDSNLQFAR